MTAPITQANEYVQPQAPQQPSPPPSYTQYPEHSTPPQQAATPYAQGQPYPPHYYAPRQGVPQWAWIGGGLFLLTLIAVGILTLVLVLGGNRGGTAGAANSPADATRNFYQRWGARDFNGAYALIAPESQASTNPDQLKSVMEQYEAQLGAFQAVTVSNNAEQGENATNTATIKFANGQEVTANVRLKKINNQWLIVSN